jgi:hypothetical protein
VTLAGRIGRLEARRDAGESELVGVVVMGGEDEAQRISEELARRGVRPERAHVAIVRVPQHAESIEQWTENWNPGYQPEKVST